MKFLHFICRTPSLGIVREWMPDIFVSLLGTDLIVPALRGKCLGGLV